MGFNVNITWHFTQEAQARTQRLRGNPPVFNWPASDLGLFPSVGDWVSFPGYEEFTFVVFSREFQFTNADQLNLNYILDILLEEDRRKMLRLAKYRARA